MNKIISFVWLLLFIGSVNVLNSYCDELVELSGNCQRGVRPLSGSPFSLFIFCEDALGNSLSVVYSGQMASPVDNAWDMNDRFWHDELWTTDVTSYYYNQQKTTLFVATSGVYGTGGIYKLDLMKRKTIKLISGNVPEEKIYKLKNVNNEKKQLNYQVTLLEGKIIQEGSVSLE